MFASPLTRCDVVVNVGSLTMVVPNAGSVETCRWYDVARAAAYQLNVNDVGWFVAPSDGKESTGVGGAATIVVKLHSLDHALVPPPIRCVHMPVVGRVVRKER